METLACWILLSRFLSLLTEGPDLGLRQLLALIQLLEQLLNPWVQLLGEHLLIHDTIHDAICPNWLPLCTVPALPPTRCHRFPGHFSATVGHSGPPLAAGSCHSAWPSAAGLPPLALALELGSVIYIGCLHSFTPQVPLSPLSLPWASPMHCNCSQGLGPPSWGQSPL